MLPAYLDYWGLAEVPFSLAPNPRMFYLSDQHRECLMRLKFAIHSGKGGALLISENAGNGKTTTLNLLMRELSEDEGQYRIAYLDYPTMTPEQMIGEISRQIGVGDVSGDKVTDMNALRDMLRSNHIRGLKNLVIVDEGQMMADRPELLQEFRILLNCCSAGEFLLSFILSGQAALEPAVRALPEFWQRLPVRFFLKDLHQADTSGMIHHRLKVAGATRPIFTSTATEGVYRYSKGCPRVICAVADLALVVGHSNKARQVDFSEVSQACSDMEHSGTSYHYFNFLEEEGQGGNTVPQPAAQPVSSSPLTETSPVTGGVMRDVDPIPTGPPANATPIPAATEMPAVAMGGAGVAQPMAAPMPTPKPLLTPVVPTMPEMVAAPTPLATPTQTESPQAAGEEVCVACGTHCMAGTDVCPKCAAMLRVSCGKCGASQEARAKACGYCGFPLHAWAKEAEREFMAGLKRLNLYKTPDQLEEIKFSQHRTLEGRVLYFAAAAKMMRSGAKVREVKGDGTGRVKGCAVMIGNRRLVMLDGKRSRDIPLGEISHCEPIVEPGKDAGGVVVRYRNKAFELYLPVREGRRAGFYRLLQAYLNRMGKSEG
jgi:type II secretory pathway predicted ATPase ExeA